jgi:hypothetical protein
MMPLRLGGNGRHKVLVIAMELNRLVFNVVEFPPYEGGVGPDRLQDL